MKLLEELLDTFKPKHKVKCSKSIPKRFGRDRKVEFEVELNISRSRMNIDGKVRDVISLSQTE